MPRNVHNFWIEIDIDGRKERIKVGPESADGGFTMVIYQRDKRQVSGISEALLIWAAADGETLTLTITPEDRKEGRFHVVTKR